MELLDTTNYKNKSFKVSDNIVTEKYEDCLILLHLKKNKFFKLNSTGTAIFELVQQEKTFEEIFELLKNKYSECDINNVYEYLKKLEIQEFLLVNE
jgi:hypothetical protein